MGIEERAKVLAFVRFLLRDLPRSRDRKDILKLTGVFDSASIKEMSAVIKADCENIDKDEW